MIIKTCPMCDGDLYPHCDAIRHQRYFSHTCDLVVCRRCGKLGTLDGRWWPDGSVVDERLTKSSSFREMLKSILELWDDVEERDIP